MTKIVKATLGFALAIGASVGATLTSGNDAKSVSAYTSTTRFELVTSTSQLVAGAKYIMGATYKGNNYFVNKTSNTNNRQLSTASITDNKVTIGEDIMPLTLGGSSGAWTFYTNDYAGTAGYLNATSTTSNNYLKVVSSADKYNKFSIGISGNDATITCTGKDSRNIIYLYRSGQISCYSSQTTGTDYFLPRLYKELIDASINGANSVDVGSEWTPTNITENEGSHAVVTGATFSFTPSDGAAISSSNSSTGAFTASASGTVTVSATKGGYTIANKVVTINPLDPYINLTLTSGASSYTGQTVSVSAEYGNGVTGLTWTVPVGTVSNVTSTNSGYSATIGGLTGTLTIRATDSGSALYREVSVNVTKVTLTLNKNATNIGQDCSETLVPTHNASSVGGVSWESDNAKVAVDNGVITVAADAVIGTTATITATSEVDNSVSASCVVTVVQEHGTVESDPLTVAQALAIGADLIKNTETSHIYFVQGIVSEILYNFGGSPLKATFWLANGVSDAEGFEAYRVTIADGRVIDTDDLKIGAEVVIRCKIYKYGSTTIETGSVGEVVSLDYSERPTTAIAFNEPNVSLAVSESTNLVPVVTPVYSTDSISWASSNAEVATVVDGTVTAVGIGTANITATSGSESAVCVITVCDEIISLSDKAYNIAKPATAQTELGTATIAGYSMNTLNVYNDAATSAYLMFGTKALKTSDSLLSNETPVPGPITKIVFKTTDNSSASAVCNATLSSSEITTVVTDTTNSLTGKGSLTIVADPSDNLRYFAISCTTSGFNAQFDSIEITYDRSEEYVASSETISGLRFEYTNTGGGYSFSEAAIRFGGFISDELWSGLVGVEGYGVFITPTASLSGDTIENKYYLKEEANAADADATNDTVDAIINGLVSDLSGSKRAVANNATPASADSDQKVFLGVDSSDTYHIWTSRMNIEEANFATEYTAVAYVKIDGDILFLQETSASIKGLATARLASMNPSDPAYGAIEYITENY